MIISKTTNNHFLNTIKKYERAKTSNSQRADKYKQQLLEVYNNNYTDFYNIGYMIDDNINILDYDNEEIYLYHVQFGYSNVIYITDMANITGAEWGIMDQIGQIIGENLEDIGMDEVDSHPDLYLLLDNQKVINHGGILGFQLVQVK